MGTLLQMIENVRKYPGLSRKQPIEEVYRELVSEVRGELYLPNFGDDAAAIAWRDGFLLFAADGIMARLLINEPYAAGKASVLATVNDIYAKGGKPLAMVNVLASGDKDHRAQVVAGIKKGCEKLQVPMLGGHLHPDVPSNAPSLSVAILGWAKKVLHGYQAKIGDDIVFATDLDGKSGCYSVKSWDANSGKTSQELIHRLEALPFIAEREWAHAAKDVSNGGLLGTISIMMENSAKGAVIDLDSIPCPSAMSLSEWVLCFQSFGFALSVPPELSGEVIALFKERLIDAAVIGKVLEGKKVLLTKGSETETLFDFEIDKITGISS